MKCENLILKLLSQVPEDDFPKKLDASDIEKMKNSTLTHGVQYLIFVRLKQLYEAGKIEIPKQVYRDWNIAFYHSTIKNEQRNAFIHKTIHKLEEAQIPCCLLKGETLAALYPCPEARISGDTDIYIGTENVSNALRVMKDLGYEIEPKHRGSHHIVCLHPIGRKVELHLNLHDDFAEDIWFDRQSLFSEPFRKIRLNGDELNTLGYTDGAIFVVLHLIKHFLSSGVGLRQLLDMFFYLKTYRNEIDFTRFDSLMRYLKYDKFLDALYTIAVTRLEFRKEDFPEFVQRDVQAEQVLSEIMEVEAFGVSDAKRAGFYITYSKERFHRFQDKNFENFEEYRKVRGETVWEKLFPERKRMEKKYSYVRKSAVFLPVAWIHRFLCVFGKLLSGKRKVKQYIHAVNVNEESSFVQKKMELIRGLDMI